MERNYSEEIDALQQQIKAIQETIEKLAPVLEQLTRPAAESLPQMMKDLPLPDCAKGGPNPAVGHVEKMVGMHPDPHVSAILDQLENRCGESGCTGRIAYMGVFASGGRQSTWVNNDVNTDKLLSLIENRTAENVLACIGNNDRLSLLLALLRKPCTVAELVSDGGFTSTGQVYHHLKPLMAADLVIQDKRGSYIIQPHRVQGLIMMLAGVSDLVDGTYSQGELAN